MAKLVEIADPADPRLADYVSLRDVQLRKCKEAADGLFIAEGEKVVRRAVDAGYQARSFLMSRRWLGGLEEQLAAADVPCFVVSEQVAEAVTGFHVHRGALASLQRRPLPSVAQVLAGASRIALLEDIVDHTNVGAIFRCAAALGVEAVLLSPRCADPLYRRSLKVAMGAVFAVPWTRLDAWYDAVPRLTEAGFTTLALTPAADAVDLASLVSSTDGSRLRPRRRICTILGAEGAGLSSRWLSSADYRVVIPMTEGVDSLNVAAAAAVAFYVLRDGVVS